MKIVFFGTPQIAATILQALIDSEHTIAAVVTQPDRGSGRGHNIKFQPVKELALSLDIPVMQPESVSDPEFLEALRSIDADIHVVMAYAQKLPNEILEMAPKGCINVHPSLLPLYRGAAPILGAILNGDKVTGVTIMKMAEKMDTGDILMQREMEILPEDTTGSLEARAAVVGGELLVETINGLGEGTIVPVPQDDSKSTYVRQLKKDAGRIDFSREAAYVERQIRAFDPWPGTFTHLAGKTFKILKASYEDVQADQAPGTVVYADKKHIKIAAGKGVIIPEIVQLEGKKKMTMEEFLRGKKIETGTVFGEEQG